MTRIYGATLELPKESLNEVAQAVWVWAHGRDATDPGPWRDGEVAVGPRRIVSESAAEGSSEVRRLSLVHPDARLSETTWRTTVDLAGKGSTMSIGILLERDDDESAEAAPEGARTVPRIVRELIARGAWSGHQQLSDELELVTGSDLVEEFVEGVLLDPNRRLPVVLVTPRIEGGYPLDVEAYAELAHGLAGVGLVYAMPDPQDTYRLSDRVGKTYSAWHGAVRLYNAGLRLDGNPYDHPLYLAPRLSVWSLRWLRRSLVTQAAEQHALSPAVSSALTRRRSALERERLLARASAADSLEVELDLYKEEVERLSGSLDELRIEHDHVRSELADREQEIGDLRAKVAAMRLALAGKGQPWTEEEPPPLPEPETLDEAVLRAHDEFAMTVTITDDAMRSASRMNAIDVPARKLWKALSDLNEVGLLWQTERMGGRGFADHFKDRGWIVGICSPVTVGRHRDAYYFRYEGRQVHVSEHIKLSRGDRVYWHVDDERRRFVVNHIGEHLPDSTTG